jgi:20S proteasome alpha/beta subunit
MTLIVGARCKDGVVLIADRMVLNSSRLVDKIRRPENLNVIFSAGGLESVFEDYLDDLIKNVNLMYNWFQEENKKKS